MGPSHGGMQRSLEMMKEMARTGKRKERDTFEHWLPIVTVGVALPLFIVLILIFG